LDLINILILVSSNPDTVYLRELGCEERIYFSKPEGVREQNSFGKTV